MKDILTEIVEKRQDDIKRLGVNFGIQLPEKRQRKVHPFPAKGAILEVKRASPSKGNIAPELNAGETAISYAESGAAAISCLTETNYFKGSLKDLMEVCRNLDKYASDKKCKNTPAVLRKDFLLSPEEIEVSYLAGADAVLLIARLLDEENLVAMAEKAAACKMTSLVEVRSDTDLEKLALLAKKVDKKYLACGVNSRDLADFKIDLLKPCSLLFKIRSIFNQDDSIPVIFESGIRTKEAAYFAGSLGFSGMLLGEAAAKNPLIRKDLVKSFESARPTKNADFWLSLSREKKSAPLIKICGLTNAEDVSLAEKSGADFLGFIFASGYERNVCDKKIAEIIPALKNVKAKKIAVITEINSKEAECAIKYVENGILDCLQFHNIPYKAIPEKLLNLPHYFAVSDREKDINSAVEELFLKGEARILQDCRSHNYDENQKLWIAGGLSPENVYEIVKKFQPELIDLSSGIESEVCKKDSEKVKKLFLEIEKARN
ncbi:MAG: bifunctional indole-3-glycerol phosphate synthase/phosphoribosylanthranilate isomerase [Treponema sp.]|nr:bifunctional indole-3-glycerol phosphate synthase/phosphoribosylanthranilate isomerase [Treponema sp.]